MPTSTHQAVLLCLYDLALSRAPPTSGASVCASSSSTASGFLRQRAINARVRSCRTGPSGRHSAEPTDATPTFARQPPGDAASRRQRVRKRFVVGDAVRRQRLDGHRPLGAGGPEPLEQHGLAVSSRPQQDDVVGRGDAGDEVAEAARAPPCWTPRPVRAGGRAPSPGRKRRAGGFFTNLPVYRSDVAGGPARPARDVRARHREHRAARALRLVRVE